jgi:hypothetical protein
LRTAPKPAKQTNEQCIPNQQTDRDCVQEDPNSDVLVKGLFNFLAEKWVRYRCPIIRFRKNIWYVIINSALPRIREECGA